MIQSTELKKFNKQKGPSEDSSVPHEREKSANTSGEAEWDWECGGSGEPELVLGEG